MDDTPPKQYDLPEPLPPLGAWADDAACRGAGPEMFFPERGQPNDKAKAACAGCRVADECRSYAIAVGPRVQGYWASSERQRRRAREGTPRKAEAAA